MSKNLKLNESILEKKLTYYFDRIMGYFLLIIAICLVLTILYSIYIFSGSLYHGPFILLYISLFFSSCILFYISIIYAILRQRMCISIKGFYPKRKPIHWIFREKFFVEWGEVTKMDFIKIKPSAKIYKYVPWTLIIWEMKGKDKEQRHIINGNYFENPELIDKIIKYVSIHYPNIEWVNTSELFRVWGDR